MFKPATGLGEIIRRAQDVCEMHAAVEANPSAHVTKVPATFGQINLIERLTIKPHYPGPQAEAAMITREMLSETLPTMQ
jgi:hypothetical protein